MCVWVGGVGNADKVCRRERERTADDQLPVERYLTDIFDYLTVELTLETFKKKKKKLILYFYYQNYNSFEGEKCLFCVFVFLSSSCSPGSSALSCLS